MGLKTYLSELLAVSVSNKIVMHGPFQGLHYLNDSVGSSLAPKLLGTYEKELHPAIERIINEKPDVVIDIGAAEGYYVSGLAMRLPDTSIIAFETEKKGRNCIHQICALNGVDKHVSIHSHCDHNNLSTVLQNHLDSWLIMDIEGGEEDLLNPEVIPELKTQKILLELHDNLRPGVSKVVYDRFQKTHNIETIYEQKRTRNDFPIHLQGINSLWPSTIILKAMDEKRGVLMHWFIMHPKKI